MLTKNDFSPEEWNSLRDLPHLVGLATLMAGSSGLGTFKESMALAQGIVAGQSSDVPLVRDLTNAAAMKEGQQSLRKSMGNTGDRISTDKLKQITLARVSSGISLLEAKGSPEEISALRGWLYSIADNVAKAAKEGGFLGFGGTLVSDEEQAFLSDLRTALHLQAETA